MAKGKNTFNLYCDMIGMFEQLPDEKAGQLIKHIFRYVNDENPETDDLIINIAFEPIKNKLKLDLKKWEETCEKNKESALKRWSKNASACERIKTDAKHADKDKDKDKDKDIIIDIVSFLNQTTNSSFKPNTDKTIKQISARLRDGFTVNEFKEVIQKKNSEWKGTEFEKYLRPETLFGTKFESYLQEKKFNSEPSKRLKVV